MTFMAMTTKKGHNRLICRWFHLTATVMALLLASCGQETLDNGSMNLVALYPVVDSHIETQVMTRALGAEYKPYTDSTHTRQRIYAYAVAFDNTDARLQAKDTTGYFAPVSEGWRSSVMVEAGTSYRLFAHTAIPGVSARDISYSYTGGTAKATFNGIDIISGTDILVCRASAGKDMDDTPTPDEYPVLTEGNFDRFTVTGGDPSPTRAFLAMDHLYAKAELRFRMAEVVYDELRTIKLKGVYVSTAKGTINGSHTLDLSNGNLEISNPGNGAWTLSDKDITVDVMNGASSTAARDEDGMVELVTDEYRSAGWFTFLPLYVNQFYNSAPVLSLRVMYDVFDASGYKTRENQTAVNAHVLKNITANLSTSPQKGYSYIIDITVDPTYIYQLSDYDSEYGLIIDNTGN